MRLLLATSELHPYSKSGGLADMVGALAKSLARAGSQVGVVTPLYRGIADRFPGIQNLDYVLDVPLGETRARANVWTLEVEDNLTIYFIDYPEFFDRSSLYQENGLDHPDNAARFIFFSKSVAHLARYLPLRPEVIHVHDWQTALVPLIVQDQVWRDGWASPPKTILTIHNLAYQGHFPKATYRLTNLPEELFTPAAAEYFGGMNCLKTGIVTADLLTTVSPRYAREITTEMYGCGLDGLLRERHDRLVGILNGVDYDEWSTTNNPYLKHPFTARNLRGKAATKADLQRELGLPVNADIPLFGTISRLTDQKGIDIEFGALEEMLATNLQFVMLGTGTQELERAARDFSVRFPHKVATRVGFDQGLSHRIEAGCDFYLMPSKYEPCGLNQMYSLRYGTIPIVRITGGLDDAVIDVTEDAEKCNGIKFKEYSSLALAKAMRKALALYGALDLLNHYRRNAMKADFSWERTAGEYLKVYAKAMLT